MDFLQFLIISLHITKAISKRKYDSSSEESIENLLYYKDCQHRRSQTTTTPPHHSKMIEPVRENPCPYPKMCCSMSCDDTCNGGMNSVMSNGLNRAAIMQRPPDVVQPFMPMNPALRQDHFVPPGMKQRGRKKNLQPTDLLPPIGGRRDFGFTKEKIKSLISQDVDIRKILKDLVRVTMQKVDLIEMTNAGRSNRADEGEDEREQLYKKDDELE